MSKDHSNDSASAQFSVAEQQKEILKLTKELQQDPNDVTRLIKLATHLMAVADLTQAQQLLAHAAVLAPEDPAIPYNQAVIAHQLHDDQQAITLLRPLMTSTLAAAANYLLAVIYFEQQQLQLASAFALTALERRPQGFAENLLLAQILTKQQLWSAARPYAQKAYKLAPDDADAAFVLGGCLLNQQQAARGEALLKQAAQQAPKKYQQAVNAIFGTKQ
ncbi:tetratricopeptide repeat protein [Lapidilactobacillus luobeiensis]|uniref:tetratricopeptide repeat protein n=1 Tax=Lapidilactobacillus luobeiensis TaxID=2950371 RepID=UPI0021C2D078|nr:tetratricopeptide repeat protein [Lapidilactobacillus luobeiensis]